MQSGRFCIKLNEQYTSAIPPRPAARREPEIPSASGVRNIHETHLESLIAEDLDHVEPGLTLIGRQYPAPPVGRIDLLCRDRKGDIVVIEIKKFGAATDSIIDQIARYMGWARHHFAKTGQQVRGIIIVSKPDEKLGYAASSVPGLSIKVFDVSLRDHPVYR
jgi:RecB family endonuclease NucS